MVASKKVEIGGIGVGLRRFGPGSDGDVLFKSIFNNKDDTAWWGLRDKLRGAPQIEWFGAGGKEDAHTCDVAIVRPMLRIGESDSKPTPTIVWLESHGYFTGEGVWMSVARANIFDESGRLIATEPGAPEKPALHYEGQMAGFLAQPEVRASLNDAFIELAR